MTLTQAGETLRGYAETMALMERRTLREMGRQPGPLDAPVRLAVTADTVASWVLPALPQRKYLQFDLVIEDQEHTAELIVQGAVAGAITTRGLPITGCDLYDLGPLHYAAFAAPEFAEVYFPEGFTAEEVLHAPALTFNRKDGLQVAFARAATGVAFRTLRTHYLPSTEGITEAARAGLGLGGEPHKSGRAPV